MSDLSSWPRRSYSPNAGAPALLWVVYGQFQPLRLDGAKYRTAGLPEGLEKLSVLKGEPQFPDFPFRDTWAEVAQHDRPGLLDLARRAPEAVVLQGTVRHADTLDYLRDLIGLCTCLFDRGGVAVVDVLAFKWWDSTAFAHQLFLPKRPMPYQHVSILQSPQADGALWLHTRGMRLFGRPDVSIHGVGPDEVGEAADLINRLIARFVEGDVLREGQPLDGGLANRPATVHHRGALDDPTFNNVFIEVVR